MLWNLWCPRGGSPRGGCPASTATLAVTRFRAMPAAAAPAQASLPFGILRRALPRPWETFCSTAFSNSRSEQESSARGSCQRTPPLSISASSEKVEWGACSFKVQGASTRRRVAEPSASRKPLSRFLHEASGTGGNARRLRGGDGLHLQLPHWLMIPAPCRLSRVRQVRSRPVSGGGDHAVRG